MIGPLQLNVIASLSSNGVIDKKGNIPWSKPTQKLIEHYSSILMKNDIMVFDKKTYLNRKKYMHSDAWVVYLNTHDEETGEKINFDEKFNDIKEYFLKKVEDGSLEEKGVKAIWICGGEDLYRAILKRTDVDTICIFTIQSTISNGTERFPTDLLTHNKLVSFEPYKIDKKEVSLTLVEETSPQNPKVKFSVLKNSISPINEIFNIRLEDFLVDDYYLQ